MGKEWFATWFDTAYYHLLYRNRNEVEARQFIDALLRFLHPAAGARCIDVACGKGRHSRYLHAQGYDVTGIDLSANSISLANASVKGDDGIRFFQHDIRDPFPVHEQDFAFNLFTSFGYFNNDTEHKQALQNIHDCLKNGGQFVMDYLNTTEVIASLKRTDEKSVDGVHFSIQRYLEEPSIVKSIDVTDGSDTHHFEERVRAFSKADLCTLLEQVGFTIKEVFGNYQLDAYDEQSARVIIIAEKNA